MVIFPGAAAQWLEKEFGGSFQEAESEVVTAAAAVSAVGNDPDAVALLFVNFGATDIYVTLKGNPAGNAGIKLVANGGSVAFALRDDFTLPSREWFARSPGGAGSLYVLRLRRFSVSKGE